MSIRMNLVWIALCMVSQTACGLPELPNIFAGADESVRDSGVRVQRMLDASDFDVVRVDGIASLSITCGEAYAVELDADTNLEPLVTWKVRNGVLRIGTRKRNIETSDGIHFRISLPQLSAIEVPGAATINIENIDQAALLLEVNGVADVEMYGQVEQVVVEHRGVGDLNLKGLVAEHATVRHQGVGDIDVHASMSLDAVSKGQGDIHYYGDPASLRLKQDGLSHIHAARTQN